MKTLAQAQEQAFIALAKLTLQEVKDAAVVLNNDFQDGSDTAYHWMMMYLEEKLTESAFCAFCETL